MAFVCSKTDEIVLAEVRDVLEQDIEFAKKIAPIDQAKADLDEDRAALLEAIKTSRAKIESLDCESREATVKEKAYRDLKATAANGAVVYPPILKAGTVATPSKRQHSEDDTSTQTP